MGGGSDQTITAEQERWTGIAQLASEYETIAATAQRDRWIRLVTDALVRAGGLTMAEAAQVISSEAVAVLTAELRRGQPPRRGRLLPRLVAQRTLLDADDVAAVLSARRTRTTGGPVRGTIPDLIAGLFPTGAATPQPWAAP